MRAAVLAALALAGAAFALWWRPAPPHDAAPASEPARAAPPPAVGALPERTPLGAPRGELFGRPPPPPTPAASPAPALEAPRAPPLPYRIAGKVVREGVTTILLAKEEAVFPVAAGETLEGGYRVESIEAAEITLLYLPLGMRQRLGLSSDDGSAGRLARLRWEGPERTPAGGSLTVALRVSSEAPLRAPALQVAFDPEVLEPLAVRPGKLFAEGFAWRVEPGSILVGASGRARDAGQVAADAELMVFVFKTLRPAAATELKLGDLPALESPGAYRVAIRP